MDSPWQVFSLGKSECLTHPIKVLLSANFKVFSQLCPSFPKSASNFEHFGKKDMPNTWSISEFMDWKRRGYLNA